MTGTNADVPWAETPLTPPAPPEMSGVDVLPNYDSALTASTAHTLSQPWSQDPPAPTTVPAIDSLASMALSLSPPTD